MPPPMLSQFKYESNMWKRLLSFMIDENIHLKGRLVEILTSISDKNLLKEMENFHSKFLKEDELFSLLKSDVAELDKLLIREIFEDGKIFDEINVKLTRFRNNIIKAELQFSQLKLEFNNYLLEMLTNRDLEKYLLNN